jgi:hypothetical protein
MRLTALALLVLAPTAIPQQGWPKPDQRIQCGPLTMEVYLSRTAHVFHLVDQISAWDNSCHGQYREHMVLSPEDEAALKAYAAVRDKRPWGQGLEQAFYVPLDLDAAIRAGIKGHDLTDEEAKTIRPVLERFGSRSDELLASKRDILQAAFAKVDRDRLTKAAEELSRFAGVKKLTVPVFPLASPSPGGGGMDGGRLRWELSSDQVSFSVLLHELSHAYFMQKEDALRAIVEKTPGLTMTLLGEGLAYAMAPGLYGDDEGDNLAYNVAKDRADDKAWKDDGPGRFREYALALRPIYRDALHESSLESFLPRARDVFLAIREVEEAKVSSGGPPKLAIAGPAGDVVRERLLESKYGRWITRFNHDPKSYAETLPKLGRGDLLVLLLAGDGDERIPADQAALSPVPLPEIERRLKQGESISEARDGKEFRVVLLAAPTERALEELARKTPLLNP